MPNYRHNLITNRWVIIAPRRNQRPQDFVHSTETNLPELDTNCPFCPGNEKMTPLETFAVRTEQTKADTPGWSIRVIPNKFPFLVPNPGNHTGEIFGIEPAVGLHEVLIDSQNHNLHFANYQPDHACLILTTLRDRYHNLAENKIVKHISIFKNAFCYSVLNSVIGF